MDLSSAISASLRTVIEILWVSMAVGLRKELWCVIVRCPGWRVHLSSAIFFVLVTGGAVISAGNIVPDLGLYIPRGLRLAIVNIGLAIFIIGAMAGLYRRALRSGPEKTRAAVLSGFALLVPFAGLVTLLATRGSNG